jgi:polyhydroxyalkanoate synthase subunit PhaC
VATLSIAPETLDAIRAEIDRNTRRARNGLKYALGCRFTRTAASPRDVVWKRGKAELWRFRGPEPRLGPPLLAFIGLVSRSYVLDLHPGNSFVEKLLAAGHEVYLLDWGVADEADAGNGLGTYALEILPRAVEAVLADSGASELNLLGYCMGGCLALTCLGAGVDLPVRALVTMATPVDYSKMGEFFEPLRAGALDAEAVIDDSGNVPASLVRRALAIKRPTADLVQYANLWQNLWNDQYMVGFQAMNEWIADHVPLPGAAFREILREWIVGNGFMARTFRVDGRQVDLGRITCPVLCVVAEKDEIVPRAAAEPLPSLLPNAAVETLRLPAGHISLACGRQAARVTIPSILEWIGRHSEPLPNG